jgi:murein DD-endopeptidase MepM/ murein hydrolase activator NlpD
MAFMNLIGIISGILLTSIVGIAHPLVHIHMSNKSPVQGDAIQLKVTTSKPVQSGTVTLNNHSFKLFNDPKFKNTLIGWIGISRYAKPRKKPLYFSFKFKDQSQYKTQLPIQIRSANFKKEHITLKPKKYKLSQNRPKRKKENQLIGSKFKTISNKKQYKGAFIWPVKGRFTSEFGTQRMYNNTPGWMHSGIDISANTGVPIQSAQSGRVILAKNLTVHGNTVMVDHGLGIVSIYNHLDQISVKLNDKINQGEHIGTVGSTGIATGSHLHFGISIQSIRVNPRSWVESTSRL